METLTKTLVLFLSDIDSYNRVRDQLPLEMTNQVLAAVPELQKQEFDEIINQPGITNVIENRGRMELLIRDVLESSNSELILFYDVQKDDPGDIKILFKKIEDGFDMVIASRYKKGGGGREKKKILKINRWKGSSFTQLTNFVWNTNTDIKDALNSFRVIRKKSLAALNLDEKKNIFLQMTIRAFKLRMTIAEIPTLVKLPEKDKKRHCNSIFGCGKVLSRELMNGYSFKTEENKEPEE
ncbi:MAG: hypothetical protein ACLFQV_04655 [Vulcanimicrobiota bacterium]